jgi:hypothetical protein
MLYPVELPTPTNALKEQDTAVACAGFEPAISALKNTRRLGPLDEHA